jgi:hypothetical protein
MQRWSQLVATVSNGSQVAKRVLRLLRLPAVVVGCDRSGPEVLHPVAVNVLLWLIWLFTGHSTNGSIPWPAWVSLAWGFFLAFDGWRAYGSLNTPITETEIERELERTQSR